MNDFEYDDFKAWITQAPSCSPACASRPAVEANGKKNAHLKSCRRARWMAAHPWSPPTNNLGEQA